jgi:hypothetical protein
MLLLLISIFVFAVAVDLIGWLQVDLYYFRIGIPIYRSQFPYLERRLPRDLPGYLGSRTASPGWRPMSFRWLSHSELAVRETVFRYWRRRGSRRYGNAYFPIMRGIVEFSGIDRRVKITGRINLWVLGALPMIFAGFWPAATLNLDMAPGDTGLSLFPVFILFVFLVSYIKQVRQYQRIAELIRDGEYGHQ